MSKEPFVVTVECEVHVDDEEEAKRLVNACFGNIRRNGKIRKAAITKCVERYNHTQCELSILHDALPFSSACGESLLRLAAEKIKSTEK